MKDPRLYRSPIDGRISCTCCTARHLVTVYHDVTYVDGPFNLEDLVFQDPSSSRYTTSIIAQSTTLTMLSSSLPTISQTRDSESNRLTGSNPRLLPAILYVYLPHLCHHSDDSMALSISNTTKRSPKQVQFIYLSVPPPACAPIPIDVLESHIQVPSNKTESPSAISNILPIPDA